MILICTKNTTIQMARALADEFIAAGAVCYVQQKDSLMLFLPDELTGEQQNILAKNQDKIEKTAFHPYPLASRTYGKEKTTVTLGDAVIGGGRRCVIAGPCAVESREQIVSLAKTLKTMGVTALRGGAFKPRSSPYSFQGLGEKAIEYLLQAKSITGLPVVCEMTDTSQLAMFKEIDMIQIGARNMQNFALLKALAVSDKPVLLKRGPANTIKEWLQSAEYLLSGGNENVILCERGIRTFEDYTRYTLDIAAVAAIKELSHLPVIVDPSHGTGRRALVAPMAKAAVAAGADGVIVEVHPNPSQALSDGQQALLPGELSDLMPAII